MRSQPSANLTQSPGRATTRLIARSPDPGSRNTTTVPRRGQRATVASTSSQSPGSIAGSIEPSATVTRQIPRSARSPPSARRAPGTTRVVSAGASAGAARDARLALAAGGLPRGVDLVDEIEQLLRVRDVGRRLGLRDLLGRVPEQLVEVRDGLEVLGLEVVVPQDVEVVLHEVRALFLDVDGAGAERRILVGGVLLDNPVDGLGLDAGLLRVVDAAGQVAVRVRDGLRGEDAGDEGHLGTSGQWRRGRPRRGAE